MPPPAIGGESIMFSGRPSGRPAVRPLTPISRDAMSVLSERISTKLVNIFIACVDIAEKVIQGQRSRS